jgi:Protein of unknown function (DUF2934)
MKTQTSETTRADEPIRFILKPDRRQNHSGPHAGHRNRRATHTIGQDEVARRAFELWWQQGCPHGRDFDHWLQAERELVGVSL